MSESEPVALPRFPGCFVCGPDNVHGLNLPFFGVKNGVTARWTPALRHIGYAQTIHGGILSSVLDEAVIWAAYHQCGRFGVTAALDMRYKRPVIVGDALQVTASVIETEKRLWTAQGEICNADGRVLVSATARIHPLSPENTREMLTNLDHGVSSIIR